MTREEAITILDKLWETQDFIHENTEYEQGYEEMQALAMAIEALSVKPQTDYISRADAIEAVYKLLWNEPPYCDSGALCRERAKEIVNALPSADRPTPNYITESQNDVDEKNDEVIERPIIEHDREWIIGCIKHDGFIKTDRFDKANQIILDALADRPSGEWQKVDEQPYFRKHYHKVCCSVCHKQGNEKYNYCPSCGARMKGGAE